jgi:hypothetical protein
LHLCACFLFITLLCAAPRLRIAHRAAAPRARALPLCAPRLSRRSLRAARQQAARSK